jgi:hypothetical protein
MFDSRMKRNCRLSIADNVYSAVQRQYKPKLCTWLYDREWNDIESKSIVYKSEQSNGEPCRKCSWSIRFQIIKPAQT